MRVHHVVAGVVRPRFVPRAICHVLVCEHADGLVLVDSGFGTADLADPRRLGPMGRLLRPDCDPSTTAQEWEAATVGTGMRERPRYRPVQWQTTSDVRRYGGAGDALQHGLTGHEVLPGITLVPMTGHTRGHAAVAVQAEDGLVVHAGDAAFDGSVFGAVDPVTGEPLGRVPHLRAFETIAARKPLRVRRNHAALRRLAADPGITVVTAHDGRLMPPDEDF